MDRQIEREKREIEREKKRQIEKERDTDRQKERNREMTRIGESWIRKHTNYFFLFLRYFVRFFQRQMKISTGCSWRLVTAADSQRDSSFIWCTFLKNNCFFQWESGLYHYVLCFGLFKGNQFIQLFVCLSVCLFVCPCVCPCVCPSFCLFTCLSVCLTLGLSV